MHNIRRRGSRLRRMEASLHGGMAYVSSFSPITGKLNLHARTLGTTINETVQTAGG